MSKADHSKALEAAERRIGKGVLPLLVLKLLSQQPLHGYALAQAVKASAGIAIPEGTLYPLLAGFEANDWISPGWDTEGPGPARKVYNITPSGHAALKSLTDRFDALAAEIGRI